MLQVGLFKPPEELSAAVAMELLYYYALAHQTSFDVRWIKGRSIAETIISPLANRLIKNFDMDVKGLHAHEETADLLLVAPHLDKVSPCLLLVQEGAESRAWNCQKMEQSQALHTPNGQRDKAASPTWTGLFLHWVQRA